MIAGMRSWLPAWAPAWARDSGVLLFAQVSTVLASSAVAVVLARTLTPHDWGVFSGFLALSLALGLVVNFGLAPLLLRDLSRAWNAGGPDELAREESRRLVGAALGLTGAVAALAVAGTFAGALVAGTSVELALAVAALVLYSGLVSAAGSVETHFQARRRLRRILAANVVEKGVLLGALGIAVLAAGSFGVLGAAAAYVAAGAGRLALDLSGLLRSERIRPALPSRRAARRVVHGSLPFALNTFALNLMPRLDAFLLLAFSAVAAGHFALADRVLGPAGIIPAVMGITLLPFLARHERDGAALRVALALAVAGAGIAALITVLAPTFVPLLFGSEYESAVGLVQIMAWTLPAVYGANALLAHLYSHGRERFVAAATLGVSLLGTTAIVAGQWVVGTRGAGVGYAGRAWVFVAVLAAVAARSLEQRPQAVGGVEAETAGRA